MRKRKTNRSLQGDFLRLFGVTGFTGFLGFFGFEATRKGFFSSSYLPLDVMGFFDGVIRSYIIFPSDLIRGHDFFREFSYVCVFENLNDLNDDSQNIQCLELT